MILVLFWGGSFVNTSFYWIQKNDYVAMVNHTRISHLDLERYLQENNRIFNQSNLPADLVKKMALEQLIQRQLFLQAASQEGLIVNNAEVDSEWKKLLEQYYSGREDRMKQDLYRLHYTENAFYQELRSRLLINKIQEKITSKIKTSEQELQNYYKKNIVQFQTPEQIEAQHILFKAEENNKNEIEKAKLKADDIYEKLKQGQEFIELAKKYSEDEGSKVDGGNLGAFSKGQMVPEFEAVAWKLHPGEFSHAVKSKYGWHIIKRGKTIPLKTKTFKEVKAQIEISLKQENKQKSIQEWLQSKRQQAKITIKTELQKPEETNPSTVKASAKS